MYIKLVLWGTANHIKLYTQISASNLSNWNYELSESKKEYNAPTLLKFRIGLRVELRITNSNVNNRTTN